MIDEAIPGFQSGAEGDRLSITLSRPVPVSSTLDRCQPLIVSTKM